MSQSIIEQLDVDGALRETADAVSGDTRAGFMAKAAIGAGGLVGSGALLAMLPGVASAATSTDVKILNFALTLEFLERDFYAAAIAKKSIGSGAEAAFAKTAHGHEAKHVALLQQALGSKAIKSPTFDFGKAVESSKDFVLTAVALEDTGVQAYKGQAPFIQETAYLQAALAIHSVEANHASWIRFIAGGNPVFPGPFEAPLTMSQVLSIVEKTKFIVKK